MPVILYWQIYQTCVDHVSETTHTARVTSHICKVELLLAARRMPEYYSWAYLMRGILETDRTRAVEVAWTYGSSSLLEVSKTYSISTTSTRTSMYSKGI